MRLKIEKEKWLMECLSKKQIYNKMKENIFRNEESKELREKALKDASNRVKK